MILFLSVVLWFSADSNAFAQNRRLAVIKGSVQDELGKPIVGAAISIFSAANSKLIKQIQTSSDGTFLTKVFPGAYTILAVANGFSSKIVEAKISKSSEILYNFKLERIGSGKTLIEKRNEKNNPKYVIRAATLTRSIYQNLEGEESEFLEEKLEDDLNSNQRILVEFFNQAGSKSVHFATLKPIDQKTTLLLLGQTNDGLSHRVQLSISHKLNDKNLLKIASSITKLEFENIYPRDSLNQISFQLADQVKLRDDIVLILGLDYDNLRNYVSPRLALELGLSKNTKFKTSFSTVNDDSWARTIQIGKERAVFQGPVSIPLTFTEDKRIFFNKNNRFESAIEKTFDNGSEIKLSFLSDSTEGKPLFENSGFSQTTRGFLISYSRKISNSLTASTGYSFGKTNIFCKETNQTRETPYQAFIGELKTRLRNGVQLHAVLRLSQKAKFFAIDPFQGKFAIYDPNLSIVLTQPLPNLGLPIRAEAVIDLRNLLDQQHTQENLKTAYHGRAFRGGISVKF